MKISAAENKWQHHLFLREGVACTKGLTPKFNGVFIIKPMFLILLSFSVQM